MLIAFFLIIREAAEFAVLQGPPHLWGLVAHNFITVKIPDTNIHLHGRVLNQDGYANMMLGKLLTFISEWVDRPFDEIQDNQDGNLHVFGMPDITRDWYALSTLAIWYVIFIVYKVIFIIEQVIIMFNV